MPTVYLAGATPGAGATAVTAGLALLLGDGVTAAKAASWRAPDPDATFLATLRPNAAPGWPVDIAAASGADAAGRLVAATPLPAGVTLVDGVSGAPDDKARVEADAAVARALDARVLLVAPPSLDARDAATRARAAHGDRLLGCIVNGAPLLGMRAAQERTAAAWAAQGVPALGVVPEDRRMAAPTVAQIADHLGAACINRDALDDPDAAMAELVEHVMVGGLFSTPASTSSASGSTRPWWCGATAPTCRWPRWRPRPPAWFSPPGNGPFSTSSTTRR